MNVFTYLLCEHDRERPFVRYFQKIVAFPGHDPFRKSNTLGERIKSRRRELGLSQKRAAELIGIDEGTLTRCENGELCPTALTRAKLDRFIVAFETKR